jgi:glycosyltransferase involved in cell wall biosynthesis
VRIGIFYTGGPEWTGGERYVRNLLLALKQVPSAEPVLLMPASKPDSELASWIATGCEVLRVQALDRWTLSWWLRQFARFTRRVEYDVWSESFLRHHGIGVTYLRPCVGRPGAIPNISWIPDFQHLHLPDMFSAEEIETRSAQLHLAAEYSARVVLSSQQAYQDYLRFSPAHAKKGRVLQFVASVGPEIYRRNPNEVVQKFGLPEKFFYLPNQFWKHKNHLMVVKALGLLNKVGHRVHVVCSGNQKDYRHPQYWQDFNRAISENGVEEQLIVLGMIPADDVFALLRQSIATVNPSLFEGWSTTVEEARSVGKRVLLSDIPVHLEQDPPGATYFDRNNPDDLAQKLYELWRELPPGPDVVMETRARESLHARLAGFGARFFDITQEASAGITHRGSWGTA